MIWPTRLSTKTAYCFANCLHFYYAVLVPLELPFHCKTSFIRTLHLVAKTWNCCMHYIINTKPVLQTCREPMWVKLRYSLFSFSYSLNLHACTNYLMARWIYDAIAIKRGCVIVWKVMMTVGATGLKWSGCWWETPFCMAIKGRRAQGKSQTSWLAYPTAGYIHVWWLSNFHKHAQTTQYNSYGVPNWVKGSFTFSAMCLASLPRFSYLGMRLLCASG